MLLRFSLSALIFLSACCCVPTSLLPPDSISLAHQSRVERKQIDRKAAVLVTTVGTYDGHGSGVYVKYKGHHLIVTASHVLRDESTQLIHGPEYTVVGEAVYDDPVDDIAILLVPKLRDRDPVKLKVGVKTPGIDDTIHYSGFPGIINLMSFEGYIAGYSGNDLVVHAYGWPGLSGSGVLNNRGELVGIATAVKVDPQNVYGPRGISGGTLTIVEDITIVTKIQNISEERLRVGIERALHSRHFDKI